MPVENAVVERLVASGRPTGRLDPADLAAAVPLDRLSVLDLADLIDRLEEAGVTVEIDPRLLVARSPVAGDRGLPAASHVEGAGAAARVGVYAPSAISGAVSVPARATPPDNSAHGHGHTAGRDVSPTLLAIGSMVAAVVLILLVVGGGHVGG